MDDKTNESEKSFESCNDESEKSFRSCSKNQNIVSENDDEDDDIKIGSCREGASDEDVSSWDDNEDADQWIYENEVLEEVGKCSVDKTVSEEAIKELEIMMENQLTTEENRNKIRKPLDPTEIPTNGKYFMHDIREDDQNIDDTSINKNNKKVQADKDWSHDLYLENKQKPLSNTEIISKYGYNIREKELKLEEDNTQIGKNSKEIITKKPRKPRNNFKVNDYSETYNKNQYSYDRNKGGRNYNNAKFTKPIIDVNEIPKRPENRLSEFEDIKITISPSEKGHRQIKNTYKYSQKTDIKNTNSNKDTNYIPPSFKSYKNEPDWDVTPGMGDVIEEMPPLSEEEMKNLGTGHFGPDQSNQKDYNWRVTSTSNRGRYNKDNRSGLGFSQDDRNIDSGYYKRADKYEKKDGYKSYKSRNPSRYYDEYNDETNWNEWNYYNRHFYYSDRDYYQHNNRNKYYNQWNKHEEMYDYGNEEYWEYGANDEYYDSGGYWYDKRNHYDDNWSYTEPRNNRMKNKPYRKYNKSYNNNQDNDDISKFKASESKENTRKDYGNSNNNYRPNKPVKDLSVESNNKSANNISTTSLNISSQANNHTVSNSSIATGPPRRYSQMRNEVPLPQQPQSQHISQPKYQTNQQIISPPHNNPSLLAAAVAAAAQNYQAVTPTNINQHVATNIDFYHPNQHSSGLYINPQSAQNSAQLHPIYSYTPTADPSHHSPIIFQPIYYPSQTIAPPLSHHPNLYNTSNIPISLSNNSSLPMVSTTISAVNTNNKANPNPSSRPVLGRT